MKQTLVALAVAVLLLGGCDQGVAPPGESNVDVDTPQLRQMKADAGIEDCAPGPGGGSLPALTLPCLGGGPDVDLADLKGPLLINVWWSGCGPCRKEMPALQAFYAKHGRTVGVLGIDQETEPGAAIAFAGEVHASYPQLADPGGEIFEQPDLRVAQAFPQFILLDAQGDVAAQVAGGLDSVAEVEALVRDHLGVTL